MKNVTKKPYAAAISLLASGADEVVLACDFDREGENIGFEQRKFPKCSFPSCKKSSLLIIVCQ
ncbi:MAG: toprim domain-containing protein [Methanolobus sp.]